MANNLKSLKVADLKLILSKAAQSAPSRATKADLVSRIVASESALQVFHALYPHLHDAPKPAQTVIDQFVTPQPPPSATNAADFDPTPIHNPTTNSEVEKRQKRAERFGVPLASAPSVQPVDPEQEKRKKRAERFGIPLVGDDETKRETRAARFGVAGQKRSAPAEAVDTDELERRRKRAERFGLAKT